MASPIHQQQERDTDMGARTIKDEVKHYRRTGDLRATVFSYSKSNAEEFWKKVRELDAKQGGTSGAMIGAPRG